MKAGTLLIIIGVLILIIVNIVQYVQNQFPTYSLFYLAAGIMFGSGIATNMNNLNQTTIFK